MEELWKTAIAAGGLAAIGAFIFWSLYKQWLTLPIFSRLSKRHTFIIMLVFLALTFLSSTAILITHLELKILETQRQVDSKQSLATDIVDEMAWRLGEIVRILGILEEDFVTIQEYQGCSDYIDKLFSGEIYFYKQQEHEKMLSLIAKLINIEIENITNLQEIRAYLSFLERTHRDKRNYTEMKNQLERYQASIQSWSNE